MTDDEFVTKCNQAADVLALASDRTTHAMSSARMRGKADGLRLAVSYMRDYPTADAVLLAKVREAAASANYGIDDGTAFDTIVALLAEGGAS